MSRLTLTPQRKGHLFALVTALSWAVLAIGIKYALEYVSVGTIAGIRMSVAFFSLFTWYVIKNPSQLKILKSLPLLGVAAGVCLGVNYFGFMKGVELTSASNTQIMIQLAPMSLILIGVFYFKETPSPRQAIGFISALSGFLLFYWDQILVAVDNQDQFFEGNLWILLAAATWAFFATFQKLLTKTWTPQQVNLIIYLIATLILLPTATVTEFFEMSGFLWLLIILLGVNTIVAYGCLGEALKRAPASHVSVIISANPLGTLLIIAIMSNFEVEFIRHEQVNWRGYVGALLVVSGVILTVIQSQNRISKNQDL